VYVSLFIRYVCTYTSNALNNKKVTFFLSSVIVSRLENSYINNFDRIMFANVTKRITAFINSSLWILTECIVKRVAVN
jgi:hypothetical protein